MPAIFRPAGFRGATARPVRAPVKPTALSAADDASPSAQAAAEPSQSVLPSAPSAAPQPAPAAASAAEQDESDSDDESDEMEEPSAAPVKEAVNRAALFQSGAIPWQLVLIATDSPQSTPQNIFDESVRQAKNEPANITYIFEGASQLLKRPANDLIQEHYERAKTFFGLQEEGAQKPAEAAAAAAPKPAKAGKKARNPSHVEEEKPEPQLDSNASEDDEGGLEILTKTQRKRLLKQQATQKAVSSKPAAPAQPASQAAAAAASAKPKKSKAGKQRRASERLSDAMDELALTDQGEEEDAPSGPLPSSKRAAKRKEKQLQQQQTHQSKKAQQAQAAAANDEDSESEDDGESTFLAAAAASAASASAAGAPSNIQFSCQKCRFVLFTNRNLLAHGADKTCDLNYVDPQADLAWLPAVCSKMQEHAFNQAKLEKLDCPKCGTKLGHATNNPSCATCSEAIRSPAPFIAVIKKRVEFCDADLLASAPIGPRDTSAASALLVSRSVEEEADAISAAAAKKEEALRRKKSRRAKQQFEDQRGNFTNFRNKGSAPVAKRKDKERPQAGPAQQSSSEDSS